MAIEFEEVLKERVKRNYGKAIELCSQALQENPNDTRFSNLQNKLLKLREAFDLLEASDEILVSEKALQVLYSALELRVLAQEEDVPTAVIRDERTEISEALLNSKRVLAQRLTQEAVDLVRFATGAAKRDAYQEARDKLERATELYPEDDSIQTHLGEVQQRLRSLEDADKWLEVGDNALRQQNYSVAVEHYTAAVEHYKKEGQIDNKNYHLARNRRKEAKDRHDVANFWARGEGYVQSSDLDAAVKEYEAALNIARDYEDLRLKAEKLLKQVRHKLEETQSYDKAMSEGQKALERQDYETAIDRFLEARDHKPEDDEAASDFLKKAEDAQKQLDDLCSRGREALHRLDLDAAKQLAHQAFDSYRKNEKAKELWRDVMLQSVQEHLRRQDFVSAHQEVQELQNWPEARTLAEEVGVGLQVEALKQRGDKAYEDKDYEQALKSYTEAKEKGRKYIWFPDGIEERLRQVERVMERQWELNKKLTELRASREAKRWGEVINLCESILSDSTLEEASAEQRQGINKWLEEARNEQKALLEKVSELYDRAEQVLRTHEPEEAITRLEKALSIAQDFPAWQKRLDSLKQEALKDRTDKEKSKKLTDKAEEARRDGDLEQTVEYLREALEVWPHERTLKEALGKAEADFDKLKSKLQEGRGALAHAREAYLAEQDNEADEALRQAEEAFLAVSGSGGIAVGSKEAVDGLKEVGTYRDLLKWVHDAAGYSRNGEYETALRLLEEALIKQPGDLRLEQLQVDCLKKQEQKLQADLEEVRRQAEEVWERAQYETARGLYRQILDQDPNDALAQERLSLLDREAERRDRIQKLVEAGDAYLYTIPGQPDHRRAVGEYREAWNLVLTSDVDKESADRLGDSWDLLMDAEKRIEGSPDTVDLDKMRSQFELVLEEEGMRWEKTRQGRDTLLLLDTAKKLFDAQSYVLMRGQLLSYAIAKERKKALSVAERNLRHDPSSQQFREDYDNALQIYTDFQDGRARKRISWGQEALRAGNYEQAIERFREAAELEHVSDSIREDAQRLQEEVENVKSVAKKIKAVLVEAQLAFNDGDYQLAGQKLEEAEDIHGARDELATLEARAREAEEQRRLLDQVTEVKIGAIKAFLVPVDRFLTDIESKKKQQRESKIREYLDSARGKLGTARENEDFDKAIGAINQILTLDPSNEEAKKLQQEIENKKKKFRLWVDLREKGFKALESGSWREAEDALAKAFQLIEDAGISMGLRRAKNIGKRFSAGVEAYHAENYSGAIKLFSQILGQYPDCEKVGRWLEEAKDKQKEQEEEAEKQQKEKEAQEKERRRLAREIKRLRSLGHAALQQRDFDTAIHFFEVATKTDPYDEETIDSLEKAREQKGKADLAKPCIGKARQALQKKSYREAEREIKNALIADSSNPEAQELKQQVTLLLEFKEALKGRDYSQARGYLEQLRLDVFPSELLTEMEQQIEAGEAQLQSLKDRADEAGNILTSYEASSWLQSDDLVSLDKALNYLEEYRQELLTLPPSYEEIRERLQTHKEALKAVARLVNEAREILDEQPHRAYSFLEEALRTESRYAEARELMERAKSLLEKRELLIEAQEALDGRDFETALTTCARILTSWPDNQEAKELRDQAETGKSKYAEAERLIISVRNSLQGPLSPLESAILHTNLDRVQQLDPDHPELPDLKVKVNEFQERLKQIQRLLGQAEDALKQHDFEKAHALCENALREDSQNKDASKLKERVKKAKAFADNMAEARQLLEAGNWTEAMEKAGEALQYAQDGEEEDVYTLLDQIKEKVQTTRLWDAQLALEEGDDSRAKDLIQEVLQEASDHSGAKQLQALLQYLQKAQAAIDGGEYERGLDLIYRAQELAPDSGRVASLLEQIRTEASFPERLKQARSHLGDKEYKDVVEIIRGIRAVDPQYPEAQELVTELLVRLRSEAASALAAKGYPAAVDYCDLALLLRPDDEQTLVLKKDISEKEKEFVDDTMSQVNAALDKNDLPGARTAITPALHLAPRHAPLLELERILGERERKREAADELVANGREDLGDQDYTGAKRSFAKAVRTDDSHPTAQLWRRFATCMEEGTRALDREKFEEAASQFKQATGLNWAGESPPEVREASRLHQQANDKASLFQRIRQLKVEADRKMEAGDYEAAERLYSEVEELRERMRTPGNATEVGENTTVNSK